MENIKVISFDIWGTLLKSNKQFSPKRNDLLVAELGYIGDRSVFDERVKSIKSSLDTLSENSGVDYNFEYRIREICKSLKLNINLTPDFILNLESKVDDLFLSYPPELIEPNTVELFKKIKENGKKIVLISNTGFINGKTMRKALNQLGILSLCDQAIFSDEVLVAKPNKKIFECLLSRGFLLKQVLHIGDSIKADFEGAKGCGMEAVIFKNNLLSLIKI